MLGTAVGGARGGGLVVESPVPPTVMSAPFVQEPSSSPPADDVRRTVLTSTRLNCPAAQPWAPKEMPSENSSGAVNELASSGCAKLITKVSPAVSWAPK